MMRQAVTTDEQLGVNALSVLGVSLSYGNFAALRDVSLDVGRGDFLALLGPSGCGKTSLLRSIAGFAVPQKGHIFLNGRDMVRLRPRQRNIGFVFQQYALFPHMTAFENVAFGLECRGIKGDHARRRVLDALALVGLEELAERRPRQLSGGQQQRVALARAIVFEPDVLLLDEPLAALDKQLRVQMQTELKSLQSRLGITSVFVTHDQEEAMAMAGRIAVMRAGEVVQFGTPEEIYSNPANAWVGDFIGSGNLLPGKVAGGCDGRIVFEAGPDLRFDVVQNGPVPDSPVLFFRAEKVGLAEPSPGMALTVAARRFLGNNVELHLDAGGPIVRAIVPSAVAQPYQIGTVTGIKLDASNCRLLPAGATTGSR